MNTHPVFIEDLAELTMEALETSPRPLADVIQMKKRIKMYPQERWQLGLTTTAEVWNGRLAMLGFIALLLELISGSGPLHFAGLL